MYSPIKQGCILIKKSTVNTGAAKFMKFFMSPAADAIWEKYGYSLPK